MQFQRAERLLGTRFREQWETEIYLAEGMMRVQLGQVGRTGTDSSCILRDGLVVACAGTGTEI